MYLLQRLACGVAGLRYGRRKRNKDNTSDMLLEIFKSVRFFMREPACRVLTELGTGEKVCKLNHLK